jgi:hypothetical protein
MEDLAEIIASLRLQEAILEEEQHPEHVRRATEHREVQEQEYERAAQGVARLRARGEENRQEQQAMLMAARLAQNEVLRDELREEQGVAEQQRRIWAGVVNRPDQEEAAASALEAALAVDPRAVAQPRAAEPLSERILTAQHQVWYRQHLAHNQVPNADRGEYAAFIRTEEVASRREQDVETMAMQMIPYMLNRLESCGYVVHPAHETAPALPTAVVLDVMTERVLARNQPHRVCLPQALLAVAMAGKRVRLQIRYASSETDHKSTLQMPVTPVPLQAGAGESGQTATPYIPMVMQPTVTVPPSAPDELVPWKRKTLVAYWCKVTDWYEGEQYDLGVVGASATAQEIHTRRLVTAIAKSWTLAKCPQVAAYARELLSLQRQGLAGTITIAVLARYAEMNSKRPTESDTRSSIMALRLIKRRPNEAVAAWLSRWTVAVGVVSVEYMSWLESRSVEDDCSSPSERMWGHPKVWTIAVRSMLAVSADVELASLTAPALKEVRVAMEISRVESKTWTSVGQTTDIEPDVLCTRFLRWEESWSLEKIGHRPHSEATAPKGGIKSAQPVMSDGDAGEAPSEENPPGGDEETSGVPTQDVKSAQPKQKGKGKGKKPPKQAADPPAVAATAKTAPKPGGTKDMPLGKLKGASSSVDEQGRRVCHQCRSPGHLWADCPKREEILGKFPCPRCQQTGHSASKCPAPAPVASTPVPVPVFAALAATSSSPSSSPPESAGPPAAPDGAKKLVMFEQEPTS